MEDIFSWSYIKIKRRLKVNGELGLMTSQKGKSKSTRAVDITSCSCQSSRRLLKQGAPKERLFDQGHSDKLSRLGLTGEGS